MYAHAAESPRSGARVGRVPHRGCAAAAGAQPEFFVTSLLRKIIATPARLAGDLRAPSASREQAPAATPMTTATTQQTSGIEWSVASRALPGQATSGDLHVVAPFEGGVLVGVVDGLGHGEDATEAAKVAVETLARHPNEPVVALVQRCHDALRQTRGVVMSLISIDRREMTLSSIGIGDVETVLYRANPRVTPRRESVLLRGGVVGYQLPKLQSHVTPIAVGDLLVFATDGVREDFGDTLTPTEPVPQIVERIIAQKFRGTDDGLVLALKYVGKP